MPRYFFTLKCGAHVFPDRVGVEVEPGENMTTAVAMAYAARHRPSPAVIGQGCVLEISDERRQLVMQIPVPAGFWMAPLGAGREVSCRGHERVPAHLHRGVMPAPAGWLADTGWRKKKPLRRYR